MYVEEIVIKRKGKVYTTSLVRESFRIGSKVNHRTLSNISKLPKDCIEAIKKSLKGLTTKIELSKIQILNSIEYGASKVFLSFAHLLELDQIIHLRKFKWRDDLLVMIIARLTNPQVICPIVNPQTDFTHSNHLICDVIINQTNNMYLDKLISRKDEIERQLIKKHLDVNDLLCCYFLPCFFSLKDLSLNRMISSKMEENTTKIEQLNLSVITNSDGCPVGLENFSNDLINISDFNSKIENIKNKYKKTSTILIFSEGQNEEFLEKIINQENVIFPLNQKEFFDFIEKKSIKINSFKENEEVLYCEPIKIRYISCFNLILKNGNCS